MARGHANLRNQIRSIKTANGDEQNRNGAMSEVGHLRRFQHGPVTSGLPPMNGHRQTASSLLKGANNRHQLVVKETAN